MINNDKNFLITINICCYNSSKYIEETIESVINQTYTNWELIIIDDGSTDNTKNLVEKYLNINNKIFYFYKENGGYPSARNKAIKIAKGEWIALIDHDDVMLPNRLENQVNEIIKYNHVKLFSGNSEHMNEKGKYLYNAFDKFNPLNLNFLKRNSAFELLKNGCFIGTETVIFNRNSALEINGYNEKYKFLGDYDFFIRLALINDIFVSKNILSRHRVHTKNAQYYYFNSGKGYWSYASIYVRYLFNINFSIAEKIVILKRLLIYFFYGISRFIINNTPLKFAYKFIRGKN